MNENKKILALSCSPARGRNSDTMLDSFIFGINKIEGLEVEKIYLEEIPIDFYSYQNSKSVQEHETEFQELIKKIQQSDALVIATPTYNFSVPAHLKNFIDRIRFISLDLEKRNIIGQPVGKLDYLSTYFLVSGGTPSWAQKILFFAFPPFWLRAVFLYFDANVIGAFYTGNVKSFENKKVQKKCISKGKTFAKKVRRGDSRSIIEKIFWRPPQKDL